MLGIIQMYQPVCSANLHSGLFCDTLGQFMAATTSCFIEAWPETYGVCRKEYFIGFCAVLPVFVLLGESEGYHSNSDGLITLVRAEFNSIQKTLSPKSGKELEPNIVHKPIIQFISNGLGSSGTDKVDMPTSSLAYLCC